MRAQLCLPALSQLSSLFSLGYRLRKMAICRSRRLIHCLDLNANYQIMVTLLKWRHHKEWITATSRKIDTNTSDTKVVWLPPSKSMRHKMNITWVRLKIAYYDMKAATQLSSLGGSHNVECRLYLRGYILLLNEAWTKCLAEIQLRDVFCADILGNTWNAMSGCYNGFLKHL